jgi:tRNA(Ile)-lysidine synthase
MTVRALGGLASRLPKAQRTALSEVPTAARPSLPALVGPDGEVACPILAEGLPGATAASLVMARFAAACGQVNLEES